jgi:RNA polymerase sigma-70 factor (ECF subfamily)
MGANRPKRGDGEKEDVGSRGTGARAPSALPREVRSSGVYPRDTHAAAAARQPQRPCTSFEDVYERHVRLVWSRLREAGVPESERDDLVQEVFLVINERIHKKGMPDEVAPVLLAITENQVRNYRRGRRRFLAKVDPQADGDAVATPSSRSSPERILARAEDQRMVMTALEKMPERAAEVLRMTDMNELSQREAAAELSCPEGTLRSRHHRARDYFRALIARLYKKDSR